jgi:hypothetical protein
MAGSVTIQGLLTGTTSGTQYVGPFTLASNAAGNYAVTEVTLASGANTITVPSWAEFAVINLPSTNAVVITLKGVTGDTGIVIDPNGVTLLDLNAGSVASFVLTAASATSSPTTVVFS